MLLAVRIALPDRPGVLAQVASCLAAAKIDIVTIDVIDRSAGTVVDDLCLEMDSVDPLEAAHLLAEVPGVVVESARAVEEPPSIITALELAAELADDRSLDRLVSGLPRALRSAWCVAVSTRSGRVNVIAASRTAPRLTADRLPWLPLDAPRRLASAGWMPTSWRMRAALGGLELAAAPLGSPEEAVLLARYSGVRFRVAEIRQLEILAGLVATPKGQLELTRL